MGTSGNEPVIDYIAETIEWEWTQVAPPNFWTTVKVAKWPSFGPDATEMIAQAESTERHYVLLWGDDIGISPFREENNDELSLFYRVWTCYVVKDSVDLQRQMRRAAATTFALYLGNPDRRRSDYSGDNNWGLHTRLFRMSLKYPQIAGSYGVGFVWSAWDISFRSPWPMG